MLTEFPVKSSPLKTFRNIQQPDLFSRNVPPKAINRKKLPCSIKYSHPLPLKNIYSDSDNGVSSGFRLPPGRIASIRPRCTDRNRKTGQCLRKPKNKLPLSPVLWYRSYDCRTFLLSLPLEKPAFKNPPFHFSKGQSVIHHIKQGDVPFPFHTHRHNTG